jgi:hypothetical protein
MRMKKFTAVLLSIVLTASLLAVPASAGTNPTLTMTPSVTSPKAGDTVSISIAVSAVLQARGLQFDLVLPSSVFENVSVGTSAASSALATALNADSSQSASFSAYIVNGTEVIYEADWLNVYDIAAQTLLTITATVKATAPLGSAAIVWDTSGCIYSNASYASLSFTKTDGSVSIHTPTAASIPATVTAPVKGAAAQTTIPAGTGYTGGAITWSPALSNGKFLANTQYSAQVTLTASGNYQFNDSQSVSVAGASSVAYGARSALAVTFTAVFPATAVEPPAALSPDAPVISAVAGNGSVTLSWSAPSANGSPITGYMLYMKAGSGSYDSGKSLGAAVINYTYTGLVNGTIYTFRQCAVNDIGSSAYSNEVTVIPTAPAVVAGGGGGAAEAGEKSEVGMSGPGGAANVSVNVTGTSADVTTDESTLGKIFGQSQAGGTVTLDMSSVGEGVTAVTFQNNFVAALQTAVDSGNTSTVALSLPGGSSIELDKNVLGTICETAGTGGLSISIVPVEAATLSTAMQGALTGQDVGAVYEISITGGSTEISSLGGTARITFAVTVGSDVKSAKVYKVYPDGTTELVKSELDLKTGEVTIERQSLSTYAVVFSDKAAWVNPYSDVAIGQWFYEDAEYISENSLMNGVTATEFNPSGTATRAMVATVLWRLAGSPASNEANPFSDIPSGLWYTDAITWAAEKEIVTGVGGNIFSPMADVTREQFAAMLYRYAKFAGADITESTSEAISSYSDYSLVDSYAVSALAWANSQGIIKGRTATTLEPQGQAQRSELAAMLHRYTAKSSK